MTVTRRQFGQLAALAAAGVSVPAWARTLPPSSRGLAFASIASEGHGALHTLRFDADGIVPLHSVPDVVPGLLLRHPSLPVLYVLHGTANWDHLPRGAVSGYRFNTYDGTLTRLATQPLSLAATEPHNGTVFLNGGALFVMTRAGIYNVLPLDADGSPRPVCAIRKTVGNAGCDVQVLTDGGTLAVLSGDAPRCFRLAEDENGARLQPTAFNQALLPPVARFKDKIEAAMLHVRLAAFMPGVRSTALYLA